MTFWNGATPDQQKPAPPEKVVAPIDAPKQDPATPADITKPPFSMTGRFLSNVDNERRYCTAQFVEGTDILLAAAHCVRNKNGVWVDSFHFTPAALDRPDAVISDARCIATKSDWVTGKAGSWYYPSDYAFIILKRPASLWFSEG